MPPDIASTPHIAWMIETSIKPGQHQALAGLLNEATEATRADPKAINYEFYMTGDTLHIFEKYADSPATLAHLAWFSENIAARFFGMVDVSRFTVYGSPSPELRKALDPMGATYMKSLCGFAR